ncbi:hypothetical protein [Wolbachia pipientis]|nr:hypothetical protein [Wolbachia pipientis]
MEIIFIIDLQSTQKCKIIYSTNPSCGLEVSEKARKIGGEGE